MIKETVELDHLSGTPGEGEILLCVVGNRIASKHGHGSETGTCHPDAEMWIGTEQEIEDFIREQGFEYEDDEHAES